MQGDDLGIAHVRPPVEVGDVLELGPPSYLRIEERELEAGGLNQLPRRA